jgi:hypothetical protein
MRVIFCCALCVIQLFKTNIKARQRKECGLQSMRLPRRFAPRSDRRRWGIENKIAKPAIG